MSIPTVRERGFAEFHAIDPELQEHGRRWLVRAHNFSVEWIELQAGAKALAFESDFETLLIVARGALHVASTQASQVPSEVPSHAVAIVPAGRHLLSAPEGAEVALIASHRGDLARRRVLNAQACEPPDPRVAPTGRPFRRRVPLDGVRTMPVAAVMASPEKPRLKMLQTETLSINLVEYVGPRDRAELSPHSHADFEQGSLAIAGDFVHHLRVPWGADAHAWREDEHLRAGSPSVLVIPGGLVHTSEGVGAGRHFLVDVFSPPRADFIANGWVFNARDYEPTAGTRA